MQILYYIKYYLDNSVSISKMTKKDRVSILEKLYIDISTWVEKDIRDKCSLTEKIKITHY